MTYVKATLGEKLVRNRYFDGLMVTAPWAVLFDGVTSWTVNHQDIVPAFWNNLVHLLFFVFMDITILVLGIYVDFENPAIRKLTLHNERMIEGFATLVENRDNNTGGHIKRTRAYVNLMLHKMRRDKRYRDIVNRDYLINVSNAAPLHDIGKIATPDHILQKPGKLTDGEYTIMKEHAARGGEIIQNTFNSLDNPEFQQIAYEVARYHHEKYNGKGYPDGLAGEELPLHARVMAIADVFDPELTEIFLNAREEVEKMLRG